MKFLFALTIIPICISCSHAPTGRSSLPSWVQSQSSSFLIVCSSEGLDPQQLQELSEAKCLSSAARSKGVEISIQQKTVQSLSGSDSGEVAEVVPIHSKIQCDFKNRFLEELSSGSYRLWLGCYPRKIETTQLRDRFERQPASDVPKLPYKRGTLQLTCSPAPDKVTVGGSRGERVIENASTQISVEIKEGDEWVEVKRQKYQSKRIRIQNWEHGDSISEAVLLEPEL